MHNLTKIKIFRCLLWITYPVAVILLYPFAMIRKKNKSHIFFLFDRYAIGGAQKIHLDILKSVEDIPKQVYFTRQSPNDRLKDAFYSIPNTTSADIHFWCDNLLFRLFSVHYFAFYINRHHRAHVLSSNSTFFYDMLPFLHSEVHKTELLHNFSYGKKGMEFFGLANHKLLDTRIVYDSFTLSNIKDQCNEYDVPEIFKERILFIQPGVDIPAEKPTKRVPPLKILYAGRGGPQKRVWLINRIAMHFIRSGANVRFEFAGPLDGEIEPGVAAKSIVHGEVGAKEKMESLYREADLILLTSAYEGFPMVIKEGMANGCVPLVTALEGNRMHLKNQDNALLIEAVEDESLVVSEGIHHIELLLENPERLTQLSAAAYAYAKRNFGKDIFMITYRGFLLSQPENT